MTWPKSVDFIASQVGVDEAQLAEWMIALAEAGFVERVDDGARHKWDATSEGAALAKATLRRQITRRTAQRLVETVAARAAEYNRTPGFPISIERVRVFGSYLDETRDRLSDVDIEVDLGERLDSALARAYTREKAPHITSPYDLIFWPEHEARRFLAGKSRSIDFQDARRGALETPMVTLYERSADPMAMERPASNASAS